MLVVQLTVSIENFRPRDNWEFCQSPLRYATIHMQFSNFNERLILIMQIAEAARVTSSLGLEPQRPQLALLGFNIMVHRQADLFKVIRNRFSLFL
jgi:hypothetical protein